MAIGHVILVPLDGSGFAEEALSVAASIARRVRGRLRLAVVHVPLPPIDPATGVTAAESAWNTVTRQKLESYLEEIVAEVRESAGVEVEGRLLGGEVAGSLLNEAHEQGCDLVVMSARGRGGLSRLWFGSVTDRLVRLAEGLPVLVVRPPMEEAAPDLARDVDFDLVVLPLDGSPEAESVLEPALALGGAFDARFVLFQAVAPTYTVGLPYAHSIEVDAPLLETRRSAAMRYLEDVAGKLAERGVRAEATVCTEADPAGCILELARGEVRGMVAMATHGRGGFRRLMLGSVADKVVRGCDRPVLLYRPGG